MRPKVAENFADRLGGCPRRIENQTKPEDDVRPDGNDVEPFCKRSLLSLGPVTEALPYMGRPYITICHQGS